MSEEINNEVTSEIIGLAQRVNPLCDPAGLEQGAAL